VEKNQIERLKAFKLNRNQPLVAEKLAIIQEKSATTENLMPFVIDAVEHHCTLGEIANVLRGVWGEYKG
jgi:methylmalonyl-CoA mutase N-terminal domain/subunit